MTFILSQEAKDRTFKSLGLVVLLEALCVDIESKDAANHFLLQAVLLVISKLQRTDKVLFYMVDLFLSVDYYRAFI